MVKVSSVDLLNSVVDQQNNADTKSMEGFVKDIQNHWKKGDEFFPGFGKQENSNLMRNRNRKKKLGTEEESSTFEASNVHNSLRIEKEKQNETSVEHSANVVSDNSNERTKILYNRKVEQGLRHELPALIKDDNIEKHSSFDIQIREFPFEMILMGSNKIIT
ncbi:9927_t:CDS:2 [Acaulospora morrowiae]|uniref:9927_t:CDS:1 n=1 Tax=Acaulospora morrowiae TaxID=94023 RepID=A0A9N9CAV3_9GLOM|nr:9927_t:CDS:2 [Acaulospora morrowiae]